MTTSSFFLVLTCMFRFETVPLPEEARARTIPLEAIHVSSDQEGATPLRGGEDFSEICRRTQSGASSIILVRGKDISEAVKAARQIFVHGFWADIPARAEAQCKTNELWVVGYLGRASSSPAIWVVDSADVRGKTIRVSYRRRNPEVRADGTIHYFFWVPVGKLEPGGRTLELYDADRKEVTLMRRVIVED